MARFKADEVKNYGGQGGGGFLQLGDDGDTVRVRFMYNSIDDVEGMSVHRIKVGVRDDGRDIYRYVNCLREYNDPLDTCPFCREKKPVQAKMFIPVFDIENNETKTWERGKKFFQKMSSICSRYPHPVAKVFEIERNGKRGDMGTTYEIYPLDEDYDENLMVDDLPPAPQMLGGFVLDKSADDMEYFLENNQFPPTDDEDEEPEVRPRRREESRSTGRRTPSNTRGRRSEDAF